MSRAAARRILVPTWVPSYMLKLRCLSTNTYGGYDLMAAMKPRTSDLLAEELT